MNIWAVAKQKGKGTAGNNYSTFGLSTFFHTHTHTHIYIYIYIRRRNHQYMGTYTNEGKQRKKQCGFISLVNKMENMVLFFLHILQKEKKTSLITQFFPSDFRIYVT